MSTTTAWTILPSTTPCGLYETPDEDTLAAWDIGYAVFDSSVYAKFAADESWYAARYDVWYENAACHVYKIK